MVSLSELEVPTENIRITEPSKAFVNSKDLGDGTLYITERNVAWLNETGQGFSLDYPIIGLHGVSKGDAKFPQPSLFLLVDKTADEERNGDASSADDDEVPSPTELRFVPCVEDNLDRMYKSMSDCQTLHPDPQDSNSEGEDDEEGIKYDVVQYFDEDGQALAEPVVVPGSGDTEITNGATANGVNGLGESGDKPMIDADQFEDAD